MRAQVLVDSLASTIIQPGRFEQARHEQRLQQTQLIAGDLLHPPPCCLGSQHTRVSFRQARWDIFGPHDDLVCPHLAPLESSSCLTMVSEGRHFSHPVKSLRPAKSGWEAIGQSEFGRFRNRKSLVGRAHAGDAEQIFETMTPNNR